MELNRAILLVDDEPIILMALRMQLRSSLGPGYRYETALSAGEALEVFDTLSQQGVKVVLVITDWLMPGMRGDEFLKQVRSSHPEVKTIMMSGQTDQERVKDLSGSGALDVFMKKPWERERLVDACRRLLEDSSP